MSVHPSLSREYWCSQETACDGSLHKRFAGVADRHARETIRIRSLLVELLHWYTVDAVPEGTQCSIRI